MIGRRPEPVPGKEPGRWRVRKANVDVLPWYVERENCVGAAFVRTWREAQDYADRMARTREYVLPRITERNAIVPGSLGLYLESGRTWDGKRNTWIKDEVGMIYVASYNLRSLAVALLALAEQEESV